MNQAPLYHCLVSAAWENNSCLKDNQINQARPGHSPDSGYLVHLKACFALSLWVTVCQPGQYMLHTDTWYHHLKILHAPTYSNTPTAISFGWSSKLLLYILVTYSSALTLGKDFCCCRRECRPKILFMKTRNIRLLRSQWLSGTNITETWTLKAS